MMDSMRLFFRNFIKYFLYIAVFAQIVSGTVYLVCNFCDFFVYPETGEMVNAARTLIFDEYIGFLYPLFVRVCLSIQDVLGIGYFMVAYLVQVILVLVSVYYMVKPLFPEKKAWIASLLVLTFPMCMQTVLMVSSFAFKMTFGFLMAGAMVRIWKKKAGLDIKALIVLLLSYALSTFNQPDDLYLWIVPIVALGIVVCFRKKETVNIAKKICVMLAIVIIFLATFGILNKVCEPGARGRMHKSVYSVMFQRTIWPDMGMKYGFLPTDMYYYIDRDMTWKSDQYAENIVYYIGPRIENAVGFEKADDLYKTAVVTQLSYNKRALFSVVSSDFAGYLLQPYSTIWYMNGQDGSAFGKLYSLMNTGDGKAVYGYWCVSFVTLFALSFVGILNVIQSRIFMKKGFKRVFLLVAMGLCYQALWYAMVNVQGVDYRYALLSVGIFILLAFKSSLHLNKKEISQEEPDSSKEKRSWGTENIKKVWISVGVVLGVFLILGGIFMIPKGYKESHMLKDKTIVCFGDSIWGLVDDETGIAANVEKMTGATVENYALSGATASNTLGTVYEDKCSMWSLSQIVQVLQSNELTEDKKLNQILDASLEDAQYLILAYGLNDYFNGISIESEDKLDVNTYAGALRWAVEYFRENYPDLRIVLIGQTYCQFYSYGIVEDDSDTKNPGGGVGTDYVEAVRQIAKEYDLLFINQYEELPINEWNGKLYLEDATHLNEKGRMEYAKIVAEYLLKDYEERNLQ